MTSIRDFRSSVAGLLAAETGARRPRPVVVLALDGVSYAAARSHWCHAELSRARSVTPTTSSAGWLSSLTGLDVAAHGVPGVVFADPAGGPGQINVFEYTGPGLELPPTVGNVFSDATGLGYQPLAVLGDMETYHCAWRDTLLAGARPVTGHRFYTEGGGPYRVRSTAVVEAAVVAAIQDALQGASGAVPAFVWCYVEIDRHIHEYGYDNHVSEMLGALERIAVRLAEQGVVTLAHADHGLVPTVHDTEFAAFLDDAARRHGFVVGGAGRMRWLHTREPMPGLAGLLAPQLPESVSVHAADEFFPPGSPARGRVGDTVLVAHGERFLAPDGYTHDHGSFGEDEVWTPFARWG
jgi:hypothetical protein